MFSHCSHSCELASMHKSRLTMLPLNNTACTITRHTHTHGNSLTRFRPTQRRCRCAVINAAAAELSSGSSRRQATLGLLSLALSSPVAAEAWSKPGLLDLPACQIFKPAGPIQYCELKQGRGDSPLAGDLVEVDYTARAVATGEVYDGSRNFKFTVGNGEMIPGFELGILGSDDGSVPPIKEGGARTLLIPPELAYGSSGDGCLFGLPDSCRIPPNSAVEITFTYKGLGH